MKKRDKKVVKPVFDLEKTFSELQLLLAGKNYVVFLQNYRLPIVSGANATDYIVQQLPDAVIGKIQSCSGEEMIEEIAHSLKYVGDSGAGLLQEQINSSKFENLLAEFLSYASERAAGAVDIFSFWLDKGHPDYPVFWDFAFVIVGPKNAEIIIGSSSD